MDIVTLRSQTAKLFQPLLERWRNEIGAGEQNRWILLGGAAVIWIVVCVYAAIAVSSAHRHHRDLQAEVARLNALVGDTSWQGRLQQSDALRFQLNERLWNAPTAGLAQAGFEKWIRDHIAKQGLDAPQVQLSLSPATIQGANGATKVLPGLQRMTAKVTTSFNPNAVAQLAADMASSDKIIVLDQLILRTQRNARMEMNLSTFVRLE